MADATIWDAVKTGGGLVLGGVLTAFAKQFFTGAGAQEKDLREGLAEEVKELRDELRALRAEQVAMRIELDGLRTRNSRLYGERETARLKLALLEQKHGEPLTLWPPDLITGGTP